MTGTKAIIEKPNDQYNDIVPSLDAANVNTIVETLCYRAENNGKQTAFIHLVDGEDNQVLITYESLWAKTRGIAGILQPY